jgi:uncharacterized membrane protein
MAFCTKCGAQTTDGTAFCPKCGAVIAASGSSPAPSNPGPAHNPTSGLAENVAGLLCYVLGWITGIIFLIIDKRPFVKFHAAQSIVVFGSLHIIRIILMYAFGGGFFYGGWSLPSLGFAGMALGLISLLMLVLWILLMVKAYQGERYKLPLAGDIAESLFGKS